MSRRVANTRFWIDGRFDKWTHVGMAEWLADWMTCEFTSFATVFQSYEDDGWAIIKDHVQWNTVYDQINPRLGLGSNSRPLDRNASA